MEKTSIKINIIKSDLDTLVNPAELPNVIFAESCDELHTVSQIVLSGKYNKEYCLLAHFVTLNENTVLLDNDRLFICLFNEIAVVDLASDKVIKVIDYESYQLFGIYKFKNGYFVRGEGSNMFLNDNIDCVWKLGCVDIFVNPKVENEFEIHDDYIAVYDWTGSRHFYNEMGEFKTEYHPEYDLYKR